MGSNPGYLPKSFLLYNFPSIPKNEHKIVPEVQSGSNINFASIFGGRDTKKGTILNFLTFKGTAANYERVIYVKTMEFKDVCILDKTDALFSTQYSDPPDMLSQHLVGKFKRLQK